MEGSSAKERGESRGQDDVCSAPNDLNERVLIGRLEI